MPVTVSGITFLCPSLWALMKMLAASSWWLPSSAIKPPPVRSHNRQRISSSSGVRLRAGSTSRPFSV
ncbi:MAG: hypothetical protein IH987_07335 [Planctomycetes bacterium]|nr:hypothetical protein [Planctomycetota bacterium]